MNIINNKLQTGDHYSFVSNERPIHCIYKEDLRAIAKVKIQHTSCVTPSQTMLYIDVIGSNLAFDLGFVVDGSKVIDEQGSGNFRKCLEFVKEILQSFPVSRDGVHAGLITYGEDSRLNFNFDTVLDQSNIGTTIDSVSYPGTESHTGNALGTAMAKLFPHSGRQNVPHVLVVITGSNSQDEVESYADELRDAGTLIFCVGVGGRYDQSQLETIASSPSDTYIMTTEFNTLRNMVPLLASRISAGKYLNVLFPYLVFIVTK